MSMLKRYRKAGGFKQLLNLIETSTTAKKEQLLKLIAVEDKKWATEIEKRMLTFPKVLTWKIEAIEKIILQIPEQTWPKSLFHLPEADRKKWFSELINFQPQNKQKHLQDYFSSLAPSPGEVEAAHLLIVKKIREMQIAGDFRPEHYDPNLSLEGVDKVLV